MRYNPLQKAVEYNKNHRRSRRWHQVVSVMASIVVFCTTYALILPAITMEDLTCTVTEHSHGPECYSEVTEFVCMAEEGEGHQHDGRCFKEVDRLACMVDEVEAHHHDDECYGEEGALICALKETEGHKHEGPCYVKERVLVCELPEAPAHYHSDEECYAVGQVLVCGISEHTHDKEKCYARDAEPEVDEDIVEGEPVANEYFCGYAEHIEHAEDCFDAEGSLICELELHAHEEACTVEPEMPAEGEQAPQNFMVLLPQGEKIPEGYEANPYTYTDNATFGVTVYHDGTAFPEGAEVYLKADQLLAESEDEAIAEAYAQAEQTLLDEAVEYDGMLAFDIRFEDADGDEVEPAAPVYVVINAKGLIPADADAETVAVQHHSEIEKKLLSIIPVGTEIEMDIVADMSEETGTVAAVVEADNEGLMDLATMFEVERFSTFTITYRNGRNSNGSIIVEYVDVDTRESLPGINNSFTLATPTQSDYNNGTTLTTVFADFANDLDSSVASKYEYVEAQLQNGTVVDSIIWTVARGGNSWSGGYYYYYTGTYRSANTNRGNVTSNATVNLVYKLRGETINFNIAGVPEYASEQYSVKILNNTAPAIEEVAPSINEYRYVEAYIMVEEEKIPVSNVRHSTVDGTVVWEYSDDDGASWEALNGATITLKYVPSVTTIQLIHSNGTPATSELKVVHDEWVSLSDSAKANLTFKGAYTSSEKTTDDEIQAIMYDTETATWYGRNKGKEFEIGKTTPIIYMEYTEEETFIGVQPNGVTVDVFNYGNAVNTPTDGKFFFKHNNNRPSAFDNEGYPNHRVNAYTNGDDARGNIVERTLSNYNNAGDNGDYGYPTVIYDNERIELDYLFDATQMVKGDVTTDINANALNLFQVDENGYYYYNSAENFAKLEDRDGDGKYDFELYYRPAKQQSNRDNVLFAPYNEIDEIDANGYHLGVHVSGPFYMPKDGMVNEEPMVFEFDGDDDVWVFIDGVLVLDIGGVHQMCGGAINFADGTITVPGYTSDSGTVATTIAQAMTLALNDGGAWVEENMHQIAGGKWIFNDYTEHQLDFFYLERGTGHSNCEIKFNLPTIPKNSLLVGKELGIFPEEGVEVTADFEQMVKESLTYTFKVLKKVSGEGTDESPYVTENMFTSGTKFSVQKNGVEVRTGEVANDGTFQLKADEIAVFEEVFDVDVEYFVQEILPSNHVGDEVEGDEPTYTGQYGAIGYELVGGTNSLLQGDRDDADTDEESFTSFTSPLLSGNKTSTVMFNNQVRLSKLSMLGVQKVVVGGTSSQKRDTYNIQVKTGSSENDLQNVAAGTEYTLVNADGSISATPGVVGANGIIKLKNGQKAILAVMQGTYYSVTETNVPAECTVSYATTVDKGVAGVISETGSAHTVTVTNRFQVTGIQLTKDVVNTSAPNATSTDTFVFEVVPTGDVVFDTQLVTVTGAESADITANKITLTLKDGQTAMIEGVDPDNYSITELDTAGYSVSYNVDETKKVANGETNVTVMVEANKTTEVTCINTTGYELPSTGGIGTMIYTLSGSVMMGAAAIVGGIGLKRRRERGQDE